MVVTGFLHAFMTVRLQLLRNSINEICRQRTHQGGRNFVPLQQSILPSGTRADLRHVELKTLSNSKPPQAASQMHPESIARAQDFVKIFGYNPWFPTTLSTNGYCYEDIFT